MDKYISDIVQVYLSIFYFLIMQSNELIFGSDAYLLRTCTRYAERSKTRAERPSLFNQPLLQLQTSVRNSNKNIAIPKTRISYLPLS